MFLFLFVGMKPFLQRFFPKKVREERQLIFWIYFTNLICGTQSFFCVFVLCVLKKHQNFQIDLLFLQSFINSPNNLTKMEMVRKEKNPITISLSFHSPQSSTPSFLSGFYFSYSLISIDVNI